MLSCFVAPVVFALFSCFFVVKARQHKAPQLRNYSFLYTSRRSTWTRNKVFSAQCSLNMVICSLVMHICFLSLSHVPCRNSYAHCHFFLFFMLAKKQNANKKDTHHFCYSGCWCTALPIRNFSTVMRSAQCLLWEQPDASPSQNISATSLPPLWQKWGRIRLKNVTTLYAMRWLVILQTPFNISSFKQGAFSFTLKVIELELTKTPRNLCILRHYLI